MRWRTFPSERRFSFVKYEKWRWEQNESRIRILNSARLGRPVPVRAPGRREEMRYTRRLNAPTGKRPLRKAGPRSLWLLPLDAGKEQVCSFH